MQIVFPIKQLASVLSFWRFTEAQIMPVGSITDLKDRLFLRGQSPNSVTIRIIFTYYSDFGKSFIHEPSEKQSGSPQFRIL